MARKRENARNRKTQDKSNGVPNPEMSQNDSQVYTQLKGRHMVSEEISLWGKKRRLHKIVIMIERETKFRL